MIKPHITLDDKCISPTLLLLSSFCPDTPSIYFLRFEFTRSNLKYNDTLNVTIMISSLYSTEVLIVYKRLLIHCVHTPEDNTLHNRRPKKKNNHYRFIENMQILNSNKILGSFIDIKLRLYLNSIIFF